VSVLYPFVAPSAITAAVIAGVAGAVGSVSAFDCEFAATAWFCQKVVWLAPRPDEPFRALTRAVSAAFPGYPPYGGAHDRVIPHLTIGIGLLVALPNCGQPRRTCCAGCRSRRASAGCG
jgi:hypothetical protein